MEQPITFFKMHGLGNDFVILDLRKRNLNLSQEQRKLIADRHFGLGCDQLIILKDDNSKTCDVFMEIYNNDGANAEACGNATRCVAALIMTEQEADEVFIKTNSATLHAWICEDTAMIAVDMGEPKFDAKSIPLSKEIDNPYLPDEIIPIGRAFVVSMGNPHAVFILNEHQQMLNDEDLKKYGSLIEKNPLFPNGTNVEFVKMSKGNIARMRVWERGAGITLACGSGSCASTVALSTLGYIDRDCTLELDGGTIFVTWREEDNHVILKGPVQFVAAGQLADSMLSNNDGK